ncbi:MAG: hypothetical protein AB1578_20900 [Thermodesulfobacteriota bacterium]
MAGSWNEGPKTYPAGEALGEKRRVKTVAGAVEYADADALGDGVAWEGAQAAGDDVAVHWLNLPGTVPMCAAGAIDRDADVYAAADGKVQALPAAPGSYIKVGKNVGYAASGDGAIAEVLVTPDAGTVKVVSG